MPHDVRYALRTFGNRPGHTAVGVISLALGLATAAGAVSLLDAFGFRPLAVPDPDTLVQVRSLHRESGTGGHMSYLDFQDLRDRARALKTLSFYSVRGAALSGPEAPPEIVVINAVSWEYFQTVGISPLIGRPFQVADTAADAPAAVVLSHRVWRRRFNADPDILRRSIAVNGVPCAIVGVAPSTFSGLDAFLAPDIWIPLVKWMPSATREPRDSRSLSVVGRLNSPVTRLDAFRSWFGVQPPALRQAQSDVDVIVAALRDAYPATNRDERANVVSVAEARAAPLRTVAVLLLAIVGVVLLVGCANVAGLLLGRAESRRQEMAVRVSLGASRRRLVRQLLTESLVLSVCAAAAGLALSIGIIRALPALLPPMAIPFGFVFQLDRRVVLATSAAAIGTSILFGLWPALATSRRGLAQAARAGTQPPGGMRRFSVRNLLVVSQIAVSLVLLVSGTLLVRSARSSQAIDPGFKVRPLLLVSIAPPAAGYNAARTQQFFQTLVERLRATPGIDAVALARRIPLDPNGGGAARDVTLPDRPTSSDGSPLKIKFNAVGPTYFDVMGTRILRGRAFTDRDGPRDAKVVLINDTMAKRYWPAADAIGQRLVVNGAGAGAYEVIGVVEDGKINQLLEAPQPYMFFALAQVPTGEATVVVHAGADTSGAAATVRGIVRALDPQMPLTSIMTLAEHMRYASYSSDLAATIVASLSAIGLTLSLIGLYGVVSFVAARRTREIGVRMALGAQPAQIAREIFRHAFGLIACGVVIGVTLAFVASHALEGSLYGVSPSDPLTFAGGAIGLTAVALAASWWPAHRAMRTNPVEALRTE